MIAPDGTLTDVAFLPSVQLPQEASGGSRLALLNGVLYATSGGWVASSGPEPFPKMATVVKVDQGETVVVADTWAFEDAHNPDGFIKESHPYGLAAGPDGMLWVADAGANTLLKVDPLSGEVVLVVTFAGIASPLPNPNRGDAMESDPVPTGIAFDVDGNAYVSLLPGFPFLPGSSKVVKVTPGGEISDFATGLTMVTDLRMGPDGHLYAVQFGEFTEQGPVPMSGAIVRLGSNGSEVVISGLSFPTSIDFNAAGDAYVTINGVGAPGSGEVVMYSGVAAR